MAQHGVNKVILIGNLGQDPEIRYMQNGKAVANMSIATSESWNDQQGQKQEKTEWHRITAYDKLAEIIGEYVKKGSKIYVEGKLQTRKWQDQQGQDKYTTEVIINQMQMLDGKKDGGNGGGQQQPQPAQRQQQQQQPQYQQPAPQQPQYNYAQAPAAQNAPPINFDDDMPPF